MIVTMLKMTHWNGETLRAGDTADVESSVARRWIHNHIALAGAVGTPEPEEVEQDEGMEEIPEDTGQTVRELKGIAEKLKIEIPPKTKKTGLIDLINLTTRRVQGR